MDQTKNKITHILSEDANYLELSDQELGNIALAFVEKHARIRPDFDPQWDDEDEKWSGPDSAMLQSAAKSLNNGDKPIIVHSDWGSGSYHGLQNRQLHQEHDAIVAAINARAKR